MRAILYILHKIIGQNYSSNFLLFQQSISLYLILLTILHDFHQHYNVSIICLSLSTCLFASFSLSPSLSQFLCLSLSLSHQSLSIPLSHSFSQRLSVVAVAVAVGGHLTSSTMLISCPLPYPPYPLLSLLPRGVRPLSSLSLSLLSRFITM